MARVPYIPGPRAADPHAIILIQAGGGPGDDDLVTVAADIASLPATVTISGTGTGYDGAWAATPVSARQFTIPAGGVGGDVSNVGRWD